MAIKKIEIQDSNGDVYHPHTTGDVVFIDNKNISDILKQKLDKNSAGGIDLPAGDGKGVKIGSSRIFEHSDNGLYVRTKNNKGFDFTDSSIRPSNTDCTVGTQAIPFDNIHLGFPGISRTGFTKLPNGIIIQWGNASVQRGSDAVDLRFPVTFPNAAFAIIPGQSSNTGNYNDGSSWAGDIVNASQAKLVIFKGADHQVHTVFWFAIGY